MQRVTFYFNQSFHDIPWQLRKYNNVNHRTFTQNAKTLSEEIK